MARIDKGSLALDVIGIGLGLFGLGAAGKLSKGSVGVAQNVGLGLSAYSTVSDYAEGDGIGLMFDLVGFIPGPPGVVAGVGSVTNDLNQGFYQDSSWLPSIPR